MNNQLQQLPNGVYQQIMNQLGMKNRASLAATSSFHRNASSLKLPKFLPNGQGRYVYTSPGSRYRVLVGKTDMGSLMKDQRFLQALQNLHARYASSKRVLPKLSTWYQTKPGKFMIEKYGTTFTLDSSTGTFQALVFRPRVTIQWNSTNPEPNTPIPVDPAVATFLHHIL